MKAMVYTKYGPPDVLHLKEVEKPIPEDNEVLVKVYAASLNASDWELLRGKPFYARIRGLFKPKYPILGSDIAGRVEAVGRDVKKFRPGDEVFGDIFESMGGFAGYVCAAENTVILKPETLTFEQAAALPQAACLALQGLRDRGKIQPGHKVLINGAGGSAGSFAIQMAKSFGAEVTGVDSTIKLEMMHVLGADHVIDYTEEDFTQNGRLYNLILDLAAHHSIFDYKGSLSPKGIYLMVGGSMTLLFQLIFLGPWISLIAGKKMGLLPLKANKDLDQIISLIENGKIKPVIDRVYPLDEVDAALSYLGEGQAQGKIIITMNDAGDKPGHINDQK